MHRFPQNWKIKQWNRFKLQWCYFLFYLPFQHQLTILRNYVTCRNIVELSPCSLRFLRGSAPVQCVVYRPALQSTPKALVLRVCVGICNPLSPHRPPGVGFWRQFSCSYLNKKPKRFFLLILPGEGFWLEAARAPCLHKRWSSVVIKASGALCDGLQFHEDWSVYLLSVYKEQW